MAQTAHWTDRYRIDSGKNFKLADHDPADGEKPTLRKKEAKQLLAETVDVLSDVQGRLYADNRWSVLLIFQAMDAAGKDGAIKHVMSGINPQGCDVHSFKAPSTEELDHDFLWRTTRRLPERGRIGVFNRSYYEEVLVVRVHPELLERQRIPVPLNGRDVWQDRYKAIRDFEEMQARNGMIVLKFFLNVSREEQRRRFLQRLEQPAKRWKFSMDDVAERRHWNDYAAAYEDVIRQTSAPHAPWYVLPADRKWLSRAAIASIVVRHLQALNLQFPKVDPDALDELEHVRQALLAEAT